MVPTIGSTGLFTIAAPFDTLTDPVQEYTVGSIRSLQELSASGDDPLNNIYVLAGATDADMQLDLKNNVPIIVLIAVDGSFIYVPASKVTSVAKITGIPYVEKTLIVTLGHIPTDLNLATITSNIIADVETVMGITPIVTPTDTSAVIRLSETKHAALVTARTNVNVVNKSYRTLYEELLVTNQTQMTLINNINQVYIGKGIGG